MAFPQFDDPDPLDDERAWTARFESFDPRNDDVYYTIQLQVDGQVTATFLGKLSYLGQDPDGEELTISFASQLRAIAMAGKTNTDYLGSAFAAP
jgi:hypothetical protein